MKQVTLNIPEEFQELLENTSWYEVFLENITSQARDILETLAINHKRTPLAAQSSVCALGGWGRRKRIVWNVTSIVDRATFDEIWEERAKERALARATDPITSHEAARTFSRGSTRCFETYLALQALGGATGNAVSIFLGRPSNAVTPRIAPLVEMGLVTDSGWREEAGGNWVHIDDVIEDSTNE